MESNLGCLVHGHWPIEGEVWGHDTDGFNSECIGCGSKLWTPPSKIDPEWHWILDSEKPNGN